MCLIKAVKRNPKNPDFANLALYSRHLPDYKSDVRTSNFDRFAMEQQKVEAAIMKQSRLTREEEAADQKSQGVVTAPALKGKGKKEGEK